MPAGSEVSSEVKIKIAGFEARETVTMKSVIFWHVMPCVVRYKFAGVSEEQTVSLCKVEE
jgi:hypothetical protein